MWKYSLESSLYEIEITGGSVKILNKKTASRNETRLSCLLKCKEIFTFSMSEAICLSRVIGFLAWT